MILQFSQSFLTDARTFIFFLFLKQCAPSKNRRATFANLLFVPASTPRLPAGGAPLHNRATCARSPALPGRAWRLSVPLGLFLRGGCHLVPACQYFRLTFR